MPHQIQWAYLIGNEMFATLVICPSGRLYVSKKTFARQSFDVNQLERFQA